MRPDTPRSAGRWFSWLRVGYEPNSGGEDARLTIDDSIPNVVKTIDALQGNPGLHYVDYLGRTVPW